MKKSKKRILLVLLLLLLSYVGSYLLFRKRQLIVRRYSRGTTYAIYHVKGMRFIYNPLWVVERKSRTARRLLIDKKVKEEKINKGKLLIVQKKPQSNPQIDRITLSELTYNSLSLRSSVDSLLNILGTPDSTEERETLRMSVKNVADLKGVVTEELEKEESDSTLYPMSDYSNEEITFEHYIYRVGDSSSMIWAVYEKRAQVVEIVFHESDDFSVTLQDSIPLSTDFTLQEAKELFHTNIFKQTTGDDVQMVMLFKSNSNNGSSAYETPSLYFRDGKLVRFYNYPQL